MLKMQRARQGGDGNLLPELVAVAVSFLLQNFDSSCYQIIQVCFQILAAMGHKYESSAVFLNLD